MKRKKINRTSLYLIMLCVFLLLVNFSLGLVLTMQSGNALKTLIRNRMLDISNTAAAMLDGDALETISADDVDTPEYQAILKTLTYYQDHIDLKYIYCIRDMGNGQFVFTVDPTVEDPGEFGEPIVYTDALYEASLGKSSVDSEPYEDRWGRFYSSYSPVFDSEHKVAGIVAVDFSADWYDQQISNQIRTTMIISLMSIFFGTCIVLLIASQFRKRFMRLYDELNGLSDGIETLAKELADDSANENSAELLFEDLQDHSDSADEIGYLGAKIRSLQEGLSRQISFVRIKAYKDSMTGLENRTSYWEYVNEIEEAIRKQEISFSVAMFDINGLKAVNDKQGHEDGDRLILKAAKLLKQTFVNERIFRIGGDEFVVILRSDENKVIERIEELNRNIVTANMEGDGIRLSISKGYAVFEPKTDQSFQDVFVRADQTMYTDKKAFYSDQSDRRRR